MDVAAGKAAAGRAGGGTPRSADLLDLTGMPRVVVPHPLEAALLRRYDGILVLKNGRIAESGSFDELMEKKGFFRPVHRCAGVRAG